MLAYLSWHRAAAGVERTAYEQSLERFHRSLAHRPPSGFRGSAALRLHELPWLAPVPGAQPDAAGYEDWYLLDDWAAVGVLEETAVAYGHATAHRAIAALAGSATGSVYRLAEGHPRQDGADRPGGTSRAVGDLAVWVTPSPRHEHPSLGALLGDGMDREGDGLWRRCLGLGPAPEYCLTVAAAPAGVGVARLPRGWKATTLARETVWRS